MQQTVEILKIAKLNPKLTTTAALISKSDGNNFSE
jgi:hypothetical protein